MESNQIYLGDCLEVMKEIPNKSIDMILCDLPYGTTACIWDSIIPIDKLWMEYNRIITDVGAICLFGSEPFSSILRTTNLSNYKYDWIWVKGRASGALHSKNKPMKTHESISIFSKGTTVHESQSKNRMIYHPQMGKGEPYTRKPHMPTTGNLMHPPTKSNLDFASKITEYNGDTYPKSVLYYSMHNVGNFHPTQKPLELCKYLINTYTNTGETILDNCAGSGTSLVAAKELHRKFIGIEKEQKYVDVSKFRLNNAKVFSLEAIKLFGEF